MAEVRYRNVTTILSANPTNGEYGTRKTVDIVGCKASKQVETLGEDGEPIHTIRRSLNDTERSAILQQRFVPGLWMDCTRDKDAAKTNNKTRKHKSRKSRRYIK